MMRSLILCATVVALGVGCDARNTSAAAATKPPDTAAPGRKPELQLRWHFQGAGQLAGDTNASLLRQVLTLPATRRVMEDALQKLARAPRTLRPGGQAAATADLAPRVRPMLDDLLHAESVGLCRTEAGKMPEWTLAVRLDDARAGLWRTNWSEALAALGAVPSAGSQTGADASWEAPQPSTPSRFRLSRSGGWMVIGWGDKPLAQLAEVLGEIKAGGRPKAAASQGWFDLDAHLPYWANSLGWPANVRWPQAEIGVAGRGANLRTTMRLTFPAPLGITLEPWKIPTNTIREPLISFTALQGVGPWLAGQDWIRALGMKPIPNQIYGWALADSPFQTYYTWRSPDATNRLPQMAPLIMPLIKTNFPQLVTGAFTWLPATAQLSWDGMPFLVPFMRPASAPESDFLVAGVFPTSGTTNRHLAPAALYAQVTSKTNLVFYDWEITENRVRDWQNLGAFYNLAARYKAQAADGAGFLWLTDTNVSRRLGNTVTEVTWTSPRELSVVRSGSVGLTGFELMSLARWLDNPAFPGYRAPQRIAKPAKGAKEAPAPHTP